MSSLATSSEWINANQARKQYGIVPSRLQRLALLKLVQVQIDPGTTPKYLRQDIERIAGAIPQPQLQPGNPE